MKNCGSEIETSECWYSGQEVKHHLCGSAFCHHLKHVKVKARPEMVVVADNVQRLPILGQIGLEELGDAEKRLVA